MNTAMCGTQASGGKPKHKALETCICTLQTRDWASQNPTKAFLPSKCSQNSLGMNLLQGGEEEYQHQKEK